MINNIQNYSYVQQEKMISELKEKLHCAIQKSIFNSDYINSKKLPTFYSNVIKMNVHNLKELS